MIPQVNFMCAHKCTYMPAYSHKKQNGKRPNTKVSGDYKKEVISSVGKSGDAYSGNLTVET